MAILFASGGLKFTTISGCFLANKLTRIIICFAWIKKKNETGPNVALLFLEFISDCVMWNCKVQYLKFNILFQVYSRLHQPSHSSCNWDKFEIVALTFLILNRPFLFVETLKKAWCEKENEQDLSIPSAMTKQH